MIKKRRFFSTTKLIFFTFHVSESQELRTKFVSFTEPWFSQFQHKSSHLCSVESIFRSLYFDYRSPRSLYQSFRFWPDSSPLLLSYASITILQLRLPLKLPFQIPLVSFQLPFCFLFLTHSLVLIPVPISVSIPAPILVPIPAPISVSPNRHMPITIFKNSNHMKQQLSATSILCLN